MTYSLYHIGINPDLNTGYIGITCNPKARFIQHGYSKTRSNTHLKNALLKYGKDVFKRNLDIAASLKMPELPGNNIYANVQLNISRVMKESREFKLGIKIQF
ncbi:MAG: hypothetical protein RLZZ532_3710 [Cyanobacteriota bacterium]